MMQLCLHEQNTMVIPVYIRSAQHLHADLISRNKVMLDWHLDRASKLGIQQPFRIPSNWSTVTDLAESGMVPSTPTINNRKDPLHRLDALRKERPQVGELTGGAVKTHQQSAEHSRMLWLGFQIIHALLQNSLLGQVCPVCSELDRLPV